MSSHNIGFCEEINNIIHLDTPLFRDTYTATDKALFSSEKC